MKYYTIMKFIYYIKNLFNNDYKYIDNDHIKLKNNKQSNNLPMTIQSISQYDNFNENINNLPKSIINLLFYSNKLSEYNILHNKDVSDTRECSYCLRFNKNLNNLSKIKIIIIDGNFNKNINNLPSSLVKLSTSMSYSKILNNLPSQLKQLTIVEIQLNNLPKKLNKLYVKYTSMNNLPCNKFYK